MTINPRETDDAPVVELPIGNFAVDGSQRQTPLLGFGENSVDKNTVITFLDGSFLLGKNNKNYSTLIPELLWGVTDKLSLLLAFPVAVKYKEDNFSSSGISDFYAQFEYDLYQKSKPTSGVSVTLVGAFFFPTGSVKKEPTTGFGSPTYFLGFTASRLAIDWYTYTSYGIILPTKHGNNTKPGNNFLYQAGIGRNIAYSTGKWMFSWLLEFNGNYQQKSRYHGKTNHNSGGNTIFLAPSLIFSTQNLILELGAGGAVCQHLFGIQNKTSAIIAFDIGWKFH